MKPRVHAITLIAVVALVCAAPAFVAACPVCYGAPDSQATQGVTAAVLSLLGITGAVLTGFVSLFVRLRNRALAIQHEERRPS